MSAPPAQQLLPPHNQLIGWGLEAEEWGRKRQGKGGDLGEGPGLEGAEHPQAHRKPARIPATI